MIYTLIFLKGFCQKTFTLLHRATSVSDGFKYPTVHAKIDGIPNELYIVKTTTGYILGGYTSLPGEMTGSSYADPTAFIFTLTNPSNMPLKLKLVNINDASAVYFPTTGVVGFGSGNDLFIDRLASTTGVSFVNIVSYEKPNGLSGTNGGKFMVGGTSNTFNAVEIEIYKVI